MSLPNTDQNKANQSKQWSGYDLIGDVHGCYYSLCQLLETLGYQLRNGVYQHPQRQAIFIGDIVDRGQGIRESLGLVRAMVDAGHAQTVLGNHEYHALVYSTHKDPIDSALPEAEQFLRPHTPRHHQQIRETLEQFQAYPDEWRDYLNWFKKMPIYIEHPCFRVVHACWDHQLIDRLKSAGMNDLSDNAFLQASVQVGEFPWKVADRLLRGTYLVLPDDEVMESADGIKRRAYRTKFWEPEPEVHQDVVFQPDPLPDHIAKRALSDQDKARLVYYGEDERPLFIGHYWCEGEPRSITPNIACLDYSAVRGGKLVAYRMDQEVRLDNSKFVWVDVDVRDISGSP